MTKRKIIIELNKDNGCMVCISHSRKEKGYVQYFHNKKNIRMHRYTYELFYGKIPSGMLVRHKCDNPPCINPLHLELGTPAENSADMIERGRSAKKENHSQSKLTMHQATLIRKLKGMRVKVSDLVKLFNVKERTIYDVLQNKTWRED